MKEHNCLPCVGRSGLCGCNSSFNRLFVAVVVVGQIEGAEQLVAAALGRAGLTGIDGGVSVTGPGLAVLVLLSSFLESSVKELLIKAR